MAIVEIEENLADVAAMAGMASGDVRATDSCGHFGAQIVHELLYTGEMRRGSQFDRFTGINHVLPRTEVKDAAFDVAGRIAEKPRGAIELLKRTLSLTRRAAFESALTMESMMHHLTMRAPGVAMRIEAEYQ